MFPKGLGWKDGFDLWGNRQKFPTWMSESLATIIHFWDNELMTERNFGWKLGCFLRDVHGEEIRLLTVLK